MKCSDAELAQLQHELLAAHIAREQRRLTDLHQLLLILPGCWHCAFLGSNLYACSGEAALDS